MKFSFSWLRDHLETNETPERIGEVLTDLGLEIESLINRIEKASESEPVKEVILALSATMEGDTTAFYLAKRLKEKGVSVSTIARGIPVGGELEFTDEVTLGRSIMTRINYNTD